MSMGLKLGGPSGSAINFKASLFCGVDFLLVRKVKGGGGGGGFKFYDTATAV